MCKQNPGRTSRVTSPTGDFAEASHAAVACVNRERDGEARSEGSGKSGKGKGTHAR